MSAADIACRFAEVAWKQYEAENWRSALSLYQCALDLDPGNEEARHWHFSCGYCFQELNRFNEAVESYTKSIEFKPDLRLLWNRAYCLRELQRYEQALADYDKILTLCKRKKTDSASAYANRSDVWSG